ncbi:hypothetical protein OOZ63_09060 [Paucibacter sp. PLA-PC-4]|uniref:hypothetical protein n=1 Tax=Paucibacter sp. PLA-PC-4 TaxID=2993655 RepID=UPI0022497A7D|nr:hypothetical protein [Paucibacter sp. PLA-PC-4]MCX2861987.1 hypothetical protein [Paucibacter sp. PLA-PC-4]
MGAEKPNGEASALEKTWSLSWQAAPGRDFLAHERTAERIRERLIAAHRQSGRQLLYYVLMPTEIHIVARIDDGDGIVGVMRSCSHILSRWVRAAHVRRGPAFAAKCRAEPLESRQALRREILMLAWRPVKLGLCKRPKRYPNAALSVVTGLKSGEGFDAKPLLSLYGELITVARAALDATLRARPSDEAWRVWELTRGLEEPAMPQSLASAAATRRAVDPMAASLIAAGGGYGVEGALSLLEAWVCAKIDASGRLDTPTCPRGLKVRARALVACMAADCRLCSSAFVARHYGCSKGTLSVQMARRRSHVSDRKLLATPLQRVLQDVAELRRAGLMRSIPGKDHA